MIRRLSLSTGLIGLAITLALAIGLVVVVAVRRDGTGGLPAPSASVSWRGPVQVSAGMTFDADLAVSGEKLYLVAKSTSTEVWASTDGTSWTPVPAEGIVDSSFVPRGAVADGSGGLLIVGETLGGETPTPAIWHSSTGGVLTRATLEAPTPAEIVGVAAGTGRFVALGDHSAPPMGAATTGAIVYSLDAWSSVDGVSWSHVSLPDSDNYQAIAVTAWSGGFAAVGVSETGTSGAGFWTSSDGSSWQRSPAALGDFGVTSLLSFGGRLVALGAIRDEAEGMIPASWASSDGRTWVESRAPVREPAMMFDRATVVGSDIVAVGMSHMGSALQLVAGSGAGATPSPAPSPVASAWISTDGSSWRLLPADPALVFDSYMSSMTALGDRPVLATPGNQALLIYVGDIAH
jgi:hypothetical protein